MIQPWGMTYRECQEAKLPVTPPLTDDERVALEAQRKVIGWFFGQCTEHSCKAREIPRWDCPKCVDMLLKELKIGEEKP